eukprot:scaffold112_cov282-Prasinococcus_capsulatus_cf.AAC.13
MESIDRHTSVSRWLPMHCCTPFLSYFKRVSSCGVRNTYTSVARQASNSSPCRCQGRVLQAMTRLSFQRNSLPSYPAPSLRFFEHCERLELGHKAGIAVILHSVGSRHWPVSLSGYSWPPLGDSAIRQRKTDATSGNEHTVSNSPRNKKDMTK